VDGVTEERSQDPHIRLFVALDLPATVRDGLAAWGREALCDPVLRPTAAENLHVTLAFLGQRPTEDAQRVAAVMEECVAPAPLIELGDPVPRPERGRPRLFALPALSPGTELLQMQLREALVSERLCRPEELPFWPHLTVARVRSEGRGSRRPMRVEIAPNKLSQSLSEAFHGVRMTLYRSVLQPSGSRYVPLAQVELPGAGRQ
jgi:2'-5' RNA ligase